MVRPVCACLLCIRKQVNLSQYEISARVNFRRNNRLHKSCLKIIHRYVPLKCRVTDSVRTFEKRLESCVRVPGTEELCAHVRRSSGSYSETDFLCLRDFFSFVTGHVAQLCAGIGKTTNGVKNPK